jgi:hypothetical protein
MRWLPALCSQVTDRFRDVRPTTNPDLVPHLITYSSSGACIGFRAVPVFFDQTSGDLVLARGGP